MDEYSSLNILGSLIGLDMAEISLKMGIDFGFIPTSQGVNYPKQNIVNINNGNFEYRDLNVETNILPEPSYQLFIIAKINRKFNIWQGDCYSNMLTINAMRLWINKFHSPLSTAPDLWNIVLKLPINFEAQAASYCHSFKWSFLDYWGDPNNNLAKSGNNMVLDPLQTNLSKLPTVEELGDKNGIVYVECADNFGNMYKVSSSPHNNCKRNMGNYKAKVYFDKYDTYPYSLVNRPNWFVYYAYGSLAQFHTKVPPNARIWEQFQKNPQFRNYGLITNSLYTNGNFSYKLSLWDASVEVDYETPATGIHCFNSTVFHEMRHVEINEIFWPNRYDSTKDSDKDNYPDDFESGINSYGLPSNSKYNFMVGNDDKYS